MARSRVDIVDHTYIDAPPGQVRIPFDDPVWTDQIWPHLRRTLTRDRGVKGLRWDVTGQVVGEMEIWIEPWRGGAIVHHYVRGSRAGRAPRDVAIRHTLRWKAAVHLLKDRLEGVTSSSGSGL
jgi:hypothetical protein